MNENDLEIINEEELSADELEIKDIVDDIENTKKKKGKINNKNKKRKKTKITRKQRKALKLKARSGNKAAKKMLGRTVSFSLFRMFFNKYTFILFLVFYLIASFALGAELTEKKRINVLLDGSTISLGDKLPEVCLQYFPQVKQELAQYDWMDTTEHPYLILAMMAQESGCDAVTTPDVMQSSESLGFPPNTLHVTDSIKQGVKYLSENYKKSLDKGMTDIKISVQAYNFGEGFISYFFTTNGPSRFVQTAAKDFACNEMKNCDGYGDVNYVENVYKFLNYNSPIFTNGKLPVIPLVANPLMVGDSVGPYDYGMHNGLDMTSPDKNSVVVAAGDGVVVDMHSEGSDFGNGVVIKHADNLYSRYAHMKTGSVVVQMGQTVKAGDRIGVMGNTGRSFGAHLHFEVRTANDSSYTSNRLDPLDFLDFTGLDIIRY